MAFKLITSMFVLSAASVLIQAYPSLNYLRDNSGNNGLQNQPFVYLRDNDVQQNLIQTIQPTPVNYINNVASANYAPFQNGPVVSYLPPVNNGFVQYPNTVSSNFVNNVNNVNSLGYPYYQNQVYGYPTAANGIPFGVPSLGYQNVPNQIVSNTQSAPVEINYS